MRTASFALLALALASPAFAADQEKSTAEQTAPIVVPFELLSSRHIAVQVKINGKGPYRLVFDTGAPMNLINNKIARASGVLDPKAKRPAFSLFGAMGAQTAKTLQIGDAKLKNVPTVVMDHPTVMAISAALGPIDGIIGFPFFARYKMTIDYQKKQLMLIPNGYKPGDYLEGMMSKLMAANSSQEPKVLAPAGLWGFAAEKAKGDDEAGVTVKDVLLGSPAAEAGMKVGDRVLTIDGRWTDTIGDAHLAATSVKPGQVAIVEVKRAGKDVKLAIKVAKGV
ncbi:MAG TPA: aspartyl protease family protein [Urbifossiella sp.]|nr:aspartyl protease family protein [Urbifossiella sp.]